MEIRNKNFDLSSIFQSISAGVCYSMAIFSLMFILAIFSKPPIINICSFFPSKTPSNLNTITTPNYTKPAPSKKKKKLYKTREENWQSRKYIEKLV
jgi:hypothetical protein